MTTLKRNGRAAPAVAVTPAALPPPVKARKCPNCGLGVDTDGDGDCPVCASGRPEEFSPPAGYTLADFITLEFIEHFGDPMRLSSIVHALKNRGVAAEPDAVSMALSRSPERFERLEPLGQGVYGLKFPLGPLSRKRRGRKLKEVSK